jgi:hypothetical protein
MQQVFKVKKPSRANCCEASKSAVAAEVTRLKFDESSRIGFDKSLVTSAATISVDFRKS